MVIFKDSVKCEIACWQLDGLFESSFGFLQRYFSTRLSRTACFYLNRRRVRTLEVYFYFFFSIFSNLTMLCNK